MNEDIAYLEECGHLILKDEVLKDNESNKYRVVLYERYKYPEDHDQKSKEFNINLFFNLEDEGIVLEAKLGPCAKDSPSIGIIEEYYEAELRKDDYVFVLNKIDLGAYANKGLGTKILSLFLDSIGSYEFKYIYGLFENNQDNNYLTQFYEKHGFSFIYTGETDLYSLFCMKKDITQII